MKEELYISTHLKQLMPPKEEDSNQRFTITLAPDVARWLIEKTTNGPQKKFANKSFAVEFALRQLMEDRRYA